VEGVQQLSKNDFETLLQNMLQKFHTDSRSDTMTVTHNSSSNPSEHMGSDGFKSWDWGGQLRRPVPETWKFPKGYTRHIMDLFIIGIPAQNIRPFQRIQSRTLARGDQQYFTKAASLFATFRKTAVDLGIVENIEQFDDISTVAWNEVFEGVFTALINEISFMKGKSLIKPSELQFTTFYDHVRALSN
jgi:hypothetical protein